MLVLKMAACDLLSVKMNTSFVPRPKEEEEKGPGLSHSTHVFNLTDCSLVGGCVLAK